MLSVSERTKENVDFKELNPDLAGLAVRGKLATSDVGINFRENKMLSSLPIRNLPRLKTIVVKPAVETPVAPMSMNSNPCVQWWDYREKLVAEFDLRYERLRKSN